MTSPRPLSERALREAAQGASDTGCPIVIESGGRVYKVMPPEQSEKPVNPADLVNWDD